MQPGNSNRWFSNIGAWLRDQLSDLLAFAGLLILGRGLWLMYPPACWVVVGSLLLVFGILGSRPPGRPGIRSSPR